MLPTTSSVSVERNWQLGETLTFFQKGTTLLKICATCLLVRKPLYWIASRCFSALDENYKIWHREWKEGRRVVVLNSVVLTPAARAKAENPEYASTIDQITAVPEYAKLTPKQQNLLFSRVQLLRMVEIENGNMGILLPNSDITFEDEVSNVRNVTQNEATEDTEDTEDIENILLQKFSDEKDVQEVREGIERIKAECLRENWSIMNMLNTYSQIIDSIITKCEKDGLEPNCYIKYYGNFMALRSYQIAEDICFKPLKQKIEVLKTKNEMLKKQLEAIKAEKAQATEKLTKRENTITKKEDEQTAKTCLKTLILPCAIVYFGACVYGFGYSYLRNNSYI